MGKIIHKLTVWTLSMLLVVSFLFLEVRIGNPFKKEVEPIKQEQVLDLNHKDDFYGGFVRINVNDEMFEDVEASLLLTVIGYVAFSVFMSLGAYYTTDFIVKNSSNFVDWYVDWYNDSSLQGGMTAYELARWNKAHEIPDYLEATGQLNLDGTLKDGTSFVLPTEYLGNVYDTASYFINDYVDAGGIDWNKYIWNTTPVKEYYFPTVMGEELVDTSSTTLQYFTTNQKVLDTSRFDFRLSTVNRTPTVLRFKLEFINKSTQAVLYTKYSGDLTQTQVDEFIQANGFMYSFKYMTNYFAPHVLPLYWQGDLTMSYAHGLVFDKDSVTHTGTSGWSQLGDWLISKVNFTGTSDEAIVIEDGFPIGYGGDENGNYYEVPIPDGTTVPSVPITPVPPEEENQYTYTPPGVTPTLPDTPEWVDIDSPASSVPFPSVGDLVDGTFVHNLGLWWGNVFTLSINTMMGWWSNFVNSLKMMLQMILDSLNNLSFDIPFFSTFWQDLTDWVTDIFIPDDLGPRFEALMTFFETKFGILLYPIEVLIDLFNRFANVNPTDRITFNAFYVQSYLILPTFFIDFSDLTGAYPFLAYIFGLIKMLFTSYLIINFFMFLYGTYESMRDN